MHLERIWLDATDTATQGTFRWTATNVMMSYTNWRPDEPSGDYRGVIEDCLQLYTDYGQWNDESCTMNWSSVCEIEYYNNDDR